MSSTPQRPRPNPPAILHDLTLDLACFWAAKTYLKWKSVEATSPTYIAYQNAMQLLMDVRAGKVLLDPAPLRASARKRDL